MIQSLPSGSRQYVSNHLTTDTRGLCSFAKAGVADDLDEGVIELGTPASIGRYIEAAKQQRVWDREARLSGDDA